MLTTHHFSKISFLFGYKTFLFLYLYSCFFDVGKLKPFLRKLLVCPDYDSTWVLCNTFNPLSPKYIQIQILQTGLHTFP